MGATPTHTSEHCRWRSTTDIVDTASTERAAPPIRGWLKPSGSRNMQR